MAHGRRPALSDMLGDDERSAIAKRDGRALPVKSARMKIVPCTPNHPECSDNGRFRIVPDPGWRLSQEFVDHESGLLYVSVSSTDESTWEPSCDGSRTIPTRHYLALPHRSRDSHDPRAGAVAGAFRLWRASPTQPRRDLGARLAPGALGTPQRRRHRAAAGPSSTSDLPTSSTPPAAARGSYQNTTQRPPCSSKIASHLSSSLLSSVSTAMRIFPSSSSCARDRRCFSSSSEPVIPPTKAP